MAHPVTGGGPLLFRTTNSVATSARFVSDCRPDSSRGTIRAASAVMSARGVRTVVGRGVPLSTKGPTPPITVVVTDSAAATAVATTYYVAPTGSDANAGTSTAAPLRTISTRHR
jgi:hypothetical protein